MEKAIRAFRGKYAFLSNMYEAPFEWDGRMYRNSEAAFQSAKTLKKKYRDDFSGADGKKAKRMGRTISLRRDWESVKDGIMEEVVRAKFSQNPELLRRLIDTGDMELVEGNSWHDTYWGVDQETGEGENHLGIILMKGPDPHETVQRPALFMTVHKTHFRKSQRQFPVGPGLILVHEDGSRAVHGL